MAVQMIEIREEILDDEETTAVENRQLIYEFTDDKLVKTLRQWYLEDQEMRAEARKRQENDWRMYSGDQ